MHFTVELLTKKKTRPQYGIMEGRGRGNAVKKYNMEIIENLVPHNRFFGRCKPYRICLLRMRNHRIYTAGDVVDILSADKKTTCFAMEPHSFFNNLSNNLITAKP